MNKPLLERITDVCDSLAFPVRVGVFTPTPLPPVFIVLTPLGDALELFSDNKPSIQIEEVRISIFVAGNYLPVRDLLTRALLEAGVTITARTYVGREAESDFHHYVIDTAAYQEVD